MNRRGFLFGAAVAPLAPQLGALAETLAPLPAVLPLVAGGTGATLASAARRAFVPKLVVQIYRGHPFLDAFTQDGDFGVSENGL